MAHRDSKSRFSLIFLKKNTTVGHIKNVFILFLSSFSLGKVQTQSRHNSLGVQFPGDPGKGLEPVFDAPVTHAPAPSPSPCGTQRLVVQIRQMLSVQEQRFTKSRDSPRGAG